MAPAKKKKELTEVQVVRVDRGEVSFCILGRTPIILNRMSEKARHELLFPAKKTRSARGQTLKHDPLQEYRSSPYTTRHNPLRGYQQGSALMHSPLAEYQQAASQHSTPQDEDAPTLLQHLSSSFKAAMKGAALDLPDVSKAEIGRLTWVEGDRFSLYGIPQMFMSIVRQAGINKTPDVRTRAIVPEWACYLTVSYVKPQINSTAVTNLLVAAGFTQGIGDWRNEKGSGSYGAFELVDEDNETFQRVVKSGGRQAQIEAMEKPTFYDNETAELYTWFEEEIIVRGKDEQLDKQEGKSESNGANGVGEDTAEVHV